MSPVKVALEGRAQELMLSPVFKIESSAYQQLLDNLSDSSEGDRSGRSPSRVKGWRIGKGKVPVKKSARLSYNTANFQQLIHTPSKLGGEYDVAPLQAERSRLLQHQDLGQKQLFLSRERTFTPSSIHKSSSLALGMSRSSITGGKHRQQSQPVVRKGNLFPLRRGNLKHAEHQAILADILRVGGDIASRRSGGGQGGVRFGLGAGAEGCVDESSIRFEESPAKAPHRYLSHEQVEFFTSVAASSKDRLDSLPSDEFKPDGDEEDKNSTNNGDDNGDGEGPVSLSSARRPSRLSFRPAEQPSFQPPPQQQQPSLQGENIAIASGAMRDRDLFSRYLSAKQRDLLASLAGGAALARSKSGPRSSGEEDDVAAGAQRYLSAASTPEHAGGLLRSARSAVAAETQAVSLLDFDDSIDGSSVSSDDDAGAVEPPPPPPCTLPPLPPAAKYDVIPAQWRARRPTAEAAAPRAAGREHRDVPEFRVFHIRKPLTFLLSRRISSKSDEHKYLLCKYGLGIVDLLCQKAWIVRRQAQSYRRFLLKGAALVVAELRRGGAARRVRRRRVLCFGFWLLRRRIEQTRAMAEAREWEWRSYHYRRLVSEAKASQMRSRRAGSYAVCILYHLSRINKHIQICFSRGARFYRCRRLLRTVAVWNVLLGNKYKRYVAMQGHHHWRLKALRQYLQRWSVRQLRARPFDHPAALAFMPFLSPKKLLAGSREVFDKDFYYASLPRPAQQEQVKPPPPPPPAPPTAPARTSWNDNFTSVLYSRPPSPQRQQAASRSPSPQRQQAASRPPSPQRQQAAARTTARPPAVKAEVRRKALAKGEAPPRPRPRARSRPQQLRPLPAPVLPAPHKATAATITVAAAAAATPAAAAEPEQPAAAAVAEVEHETPMRRPSVLEQQLAALNASYWQEGRRGRALALWRCNSLSRYLLLLRQRVAHLRRRRLHYQRVTRPLTLRLRNKYFCLWMLRRQLAACRWLVVADRLGVLHRVRRKRALAKWVGKLIVKCSNRGFLAGKVWRLRRSRYRRCVAAWRRATSDGCELRQRGVRACRHYLRRLQRLPLRRLLDAARCQQAYAQDYLAPKLRRMTRLLARRAFRALRGRLDVLLALHADRLECLQVHSRKSQRGAVRSWVDYLFFRKMQRYFEARKLALLAASRVKCALARLGSRSLSLRRLRRRRRSALRLVCLKALRQWDSVFRADTMAAAAALRAGVLRRSSVLRRALEALQRYRCSYSAERAPVRRVRRAELRFAVMKARRFFRHQLAAYSSREGSRRRALRGGDEHWRCRQLRGALSSLRRCSLERKQRRVWRKVIKKRLQLRRRQAIFRILVMNTAREVESHCRNVTRRCCKRFFRSLRRSLQQRRVCSRAAETAEEHLMVKRLEYEDMVDHNIAATQRFVLERLLDFIKAEKTSRIDGEHAAGRFRATACLRALMQLRRNRRYNHKKADFFEFVDGRAEMRRQLAVVRRMFGSVLAQRGEQEEQLQLQDGADARAVQKCLRTLAAFAQHRRFVKDAFRRRFHLRCHKWLSVWKQRVYLLRDARGQSAPLVRDVALNIKRRLHRTLLTSRVDKWMPPLVPPRRQGGRRMSVLPLLEAAAEPPAARSRGAATEAGLPPLLVRAHRKPRPLHRKALKCEAVLALCAGSLCLQGDYKETRQLAIKALATDWFLWRRARSGLTNWVQLTAARTAVRRALRMIRHATRLRAVRQWSLYLSRRTRCRGQGCDDGDFARMYSRRALRTLRRFKRLKKCHRVVSRRHVSNKFWSHWCLLAARRHTMRRVLSFMLRGRKLRLLELAVAEWALCARLERRADELAHAKAAAKASAFFAALRHQTYRRRPGEVRMGRHLRRKMLVKVFTYYQRLLRLVSARRRVLQGVAEYDRWREDCQRRQVLRRLRTNRNVSAALLLFRRSAHGRFFDRLYWLRRRPAQARAHGVRIRRFRLQKSFSRFARFLKMYWEKVREQQLLEQQEPQRWRQFHFLALAYSAKVKWMAKVVRYRNSQSLLFFLDRWLRHARLHARRAYLLRSLELYHRHYRLRGAVRSLLANMRRRRKDRRSFRAVARHTIRRGAKQALDKLTTAVAFKYLKTQKEREMRSHEARQKLQQAFRALEIHCIGSSLRNL